MTTEPDKDEKERAELIAQMVAVADQAPNAERIRIDWRTSAFFATVINIPVDKVVLNPNSHRIRAQLESSPDRALVEDAPYSPRAQEAIEELLREAEEFSDLKVNLRDVGQIEPGVVTATGVLVNANTRCVALRDNRAKYIRAAVLPSDAIQEEIDRLELLLQMKRDFHSDYTFTNELLFIEDLVKRYSYQPDQIALEMGWASKSDAAALRRKSEQVQSYLRMLALIREVQEMSGCRLRIVSFDSSRQALMELDDEFQRLKASDYQAAQELRDARLVALLTGAGYRELREIDAQFLDAYLVSSMEDRPGLRPHVETLTTRQQGAPADDLLGLDVLDDGAAPKLSTTQRSATPMLDLLARSVSDELVVFEDAKGARHQIKRSFFCDELKAAIEGAAEDARLDKAAGDLLNRPLNLVRKATKHTHAAADAYAQVKDLADFDTDRMRSAVRDLATAQAILSALFDSVPDEQ